MPVSFGCQSAAAVVAHTSEEIAERPGALTLTLGAVRLVNHGRLAAAVIAIAAPMPARDQPGGQFADRALALGCDDRRDGDRRRLRLALRSEKRVTMVM